LLQTTLPVPTYLEEKLLHKEKRINMDTQEGGPKTINIQKETAKPDIDVDISRKTVPEGNTGCRVTNVVSDNTAH